MRALPEPSNQHKLYERHMHRHSMHKRIACVWWCVRDVSTGRRDLHNNLFRPGLCDLQLPKRIPPVQQRVCIVPYIRRCDHHVRKRHMRRGYVLGRIPPLQRPMPRVSDRRRRVHDLRRRRVHHLNVRIGISTLRRTMCWLPDRCIDDRMLRNQFLRCNGVLKQQTTLRWAMPELSNIRRIKHNMRGRQLRRGELRKQLFALQPSLCVVSERSASGVIRMFRLDVFHRKLQRKPSFVRRLMSCMPDCRRCNHDLFRKQLRGSDVQRRLYDVRFWVLSATTTLGFPKPDRGQRSRHGCGQLVSPHIARRYRRRIAACVLSLRRGRDGRGRKHPLQHTQPVGVCGR